MCAFLIGKLEDTVYIEEPLCFVNEQYRNHCYILDKDVYGLKQASHVWYENLTWFVKQSNFKHGSIDPNFFHMKDGDHLMNV